MIFSLLVFFVLDLITGSVSIPGREVLAVVFGERESEWVAIIMQFRVPRAITAMLAGMALSVSGLQMQTVFRNPLAGPYVLGISSGASLGVALLILGSSSFITFSNSIFAGNWAIIAAAWIGSGLVLLLIMVVSLRVMDIMTVLILGIMFASAISAIVSIMQYFSSESSLKTFVIWTMGSLGNLSWDQLKILLLGVLLGLSLCFITVKKLNALLLGEEYAKSVGLDVKPARIIIFISTSMLAGSVTAFCGPIGFIGIAVPHITRLLLKTSSHNYLVPGTMLMGGIILLAGDIISQVPGSERILPINSVTALIGIPIMVWIIVRKNKLISIS
jgi:iron complex transport system permease protein